MVRKPGPRTIPCDDILKLVVKFDGIASTQQTLSAADLIVLAIASADPKGPWLTREEIFMWILTHFAVFKTYAYATLQMSVNQMRNHPNAMLPGFTRSFYMYNMPLTLANTASPILNVNLIRYSISPRTARLYLAPHLAPA